MLGCVLSLCGAFIAARSLVRRLCPEMPPEQRKYSRRGVQIGGYRQLPPNKSASYLQLDRGFPPHGRDIAFDAG
jgi:hypothetical protein